MDQASSAVLAEGDTRHRIRGTPAKFVGLVYDAPDEQAATAKAIEE